jgi:murein DD-endopeptidase MepM/ murein hydrolase activator NlpD
MVVPNRLAFGMPAVVAALVGAVTIVADAGASAPHSADPVEPDLPAYHLVVGERITVQRWITPVYSYHLTGRFDDGGSYWSSGHHTGLDFAAPSGTPIRSIAAGVVLSTDYDGAYGNKTVVRLEDGTEVWYCHQDSQAVAPGERVARGQVIGAIGTTGNTTGPHLHLEIHPGGGDPVDPEVALAAHRVRA